MRCKEDFSTQKIKNMLKSGSKTILSLTSSSPDSSLYFWGRTVCIFENKQTILPHFYFDIITDLTIKHKCKWNLFW
jgi:hypothetical protein